MPRFYIQSGAKVEPQMIPNILQHFSHLKRFTLGRNHKLTPKDLLYLIVNMPHLESLDIFYDWFLQGSVGTSFFSPPYIIALIIHRIRANR